MENWNESRSSDANFALTQSVEFDIFESYRAPAPETRTPVARAREGSDDERGQKTEATDRVVKGPERTGDTARGVDPIASYYERYKPLTAPNPGRNRPDKTPDLGPTPKPDQPAEPAPSPRPGPRPGPGPRPDPDNPRPTPRPGPRPGPQPWPQPSPRPEPGPQPNPDFPQPWPSPRPGPRPCPGPKP